VSLTGGVVMAFLAGVPKSRLGEEIGWTTVYYYSKHDEYRRDIWRDQWRSRMNIDKVRPPAPTQDSASPSSLPAIPRGLISLIFSITYCINNIRACARSEVCDWWQRRRFVVDARHRVSLGRCLNRAFLTSLWPFLPFAQFRINIVYLCDGEGC